MWEFKSRLLHSWKEIHSTFFPSLSLSTYVTHFLLISEAKKKIEKKRLVCVCKKRQKKYFFLTCFQMFLHPEVFFLLPLPLFFFLEKCIPHPPNQQRTLNNKKNIRLSSDAENLSTSTDSACKSVPNVPKKKKDHVYAMCSIYKTN